MSYDPAANKTIIKTFYLESKIKTTIKSTTVYCKNQAMAYPKGMKGVRAPHFFKIWLSRFVQKYSKRALPRIWKNLKDVAQKFFRATPLDPSTTVVLDTPLQTIDVFGLTVIISLSLSTLLGFLPITVM